MTTSVATLKYSGIAYKQTSATNAPWLVSFVASAEELLTWAGIPRRTEAAMVGFQRIEDQERVNQAKEFFKMVPNQSPTALIIGIHEDASPSRSIKLAIPKDADGTQAVPVELTVTVDMSDAGFNASLAKLKAQLDERITKDTQASGGVADDDEEPESANGDEVLADDDEASDEADAIEIANSVLSKLRQQLDDPEWVASHKDVLRDLSKPATIIDGQHRVRGAALCERNIPFAVIGLYDCPWPEQVFQFTVVNYSAEGIPDQFITANAALSLTEVELSELQSRLVQAQVKVIEYELMRVVQFNNESPFYNLVNLSEGRDYSKIGYKTMVRVAKDWYQPLPRVLTKTLIPNMLPEVKGKGSTKARVERWHSDIWGHCFIDFWKTVRDYYQSHKTADGVSLWTVGKSNLMIAVVLLEFQRAFFQDLNSQDEEFFDVPAEEKDPLDYLRGKLRTRAQKFVSYFPPEFFAAEWGTKALNISSGRKALISCLEKMLKAKGKYQYGKSALVTGEIN